MAKEPLYAKNEEYSIYWFFTVFHSSDIYSNVYTRIRGRQQMVFAKDTILTGVENLNSKEFLLSKFLLSLQVVKTKGYKSQLEGFEDIILNL